MPYGDGTGRLGRGMNCDSAAVSDRAGFGRGRGFCGRGFGRGRGFGFGRGRFLESARPFAPYSAYRPTPTEEKDLLKEEIEMLKQEKKAIEQSLESIEKRLKELK